MALRNQAEQMRRDLHKVRDEMQRRRQEEESTIRVLREAAHKAALKELHTGDKGGAQ